MILSKLAKPLTAITLGFLAVAATSVQAAQNSVISQANFEMSCSRAGVTGYFKGVNTTTRNVRGTKSVVTINEYKITTVDRRFLGYGVRADFSLKTWPNTRAWAIGNPVLIIDGKWNKTSMSVSQFNMRSPLAVMYIKGSTIHTRGITCTAEAKL